MLKGLHWRQFWLFQTNVNTLDVMVLDHTYVVDIEHVCALETSPSMVAECWTYKPLHRKVVGIRRSPHLGPRRYAVDLDGRSTSWRQDVDNSANKSALL